MNIFQRYYFLQVFPFHSALVPEWDAIIICTPIVAPYSPIIISQLKGWEPQSSLSNENLSLGKLAQGNFGELSTTPYFPDEGTWDPHLAKCTYAIMATGTDAAIAQELRHVFPSSKGECDWGRHGLQTEYIDSIDLMICS